VPFEDLLNDGNIGLINATKRFDPGRGTRFITYAVWWIRKAMLESIANHSLVVRMPAYRRKKIYEFRKAEAALRNRLERPPTSEETARHLKARVADVEKLRCMHLVHSSLDRKIKEEDTPSHLDFLKDDGPSAEERLLSEEAGDLMACAFRKLAKREQEILSWRLGLGGQTPLTLEQIGKLLDISRERVRQIENEAKHRLRRWVASSLRSG
jgi:RNA polymerase primary sigma factor